VTANDNLFCQAAQQLERDAESLPEGALDSGATQLAAEALERAVKGEPGSLASNLVDAAYYGVVAAFNKLPFTNWQNEKVKNDFRAGTIDKCPPQRIRLAYLKPKDNNGR